MKVSVIIPNYNTAHFVSDAIQSVQASSAMTDYEIIVVDDGSKDNSKEVLSAYDKHPDVSCIFQPNAGLAGARNSGIRAANGEYLVFLDSDDLVLPEKLSMQTDFLDNHPDIDLVYSRSVCFVGDDFDKLVPVSFPVFEGDVHDNLLYGNFMHVNSVMVRKSVVEAVGLFDDSLRELEDWDLWLRLAMRKSQFGFQDVILSKVRLRSDSMTTNQGRMNSTMLRVLKMHLQRMQTSKVSYSKQTWVKAYHALAHYRLHAGETTGFIGMIGSVSRRLGFAFMPVAVRLVAKYLLHQVLPSKNRTTQAFRKVWKSQNA